MMLAKTRTPNWCVVALFWDLCVQPRLVFHTSLCSHTWQCVRLAPKLDPLLQPSWNLLFFAANISGTRPWCLSYWGICLNRKQRQDGKHIKWQECRRYALSPAINVCKWGLQLASIFSIFSEDILWVVYSKRNPEDWLDEQTPEFGSSTCGGILWTGLGWATVEGKTVGVCYSSWNCQVDFFHLLHNVLQANVSVNCRIWLHSRTYFFFLKHKLRGTWILLFNIQLKIKNFLMVYF